MTKIKNTKKGMAKKTLSISLAVAMLATSNVPVWAAEFTDGTDAAFTSEAVVETPVEEVVTDAPVVEEEVAPEAKEVEVNTDKFVSTMKVNMNKAGWGNKVTVSGTLVDKDGNNVVTTDDKDANKKIQVSYVWLSNGVEANADGASDTLTSSALVNTIDYTPNLEDFDTNLSLQVIVKRGNTVVFQEVVEGGVVAPRDISDAFKNAGDLNFEKTELTYNGSEQKQVPTNEYAYVINDENGKPVNTITEKHFSWNYDAPNNDLTNVTPKDKVITVKGTLEGTYDSTSEAYGFKAETPSATYKIVPLAITSDNLEAAMKTTSVQYTGSNQEFGKSDVTLQVKASDTVKVDITEAIKADAKFVGDKAVGDHKLIVDTDCLDKESKALKNFVVNNKVTTTTNNTYSIAVRDLSECTAESEVELEIDTVKGYSTDELINAIKDQGDSVVIKGTDGRTFTLSDIVDDVTINVANLSEALKKNEATTVNNAFTIEAKVDNKNVTKSLSASVRLAVSSLSKVKVTVNSTQLSVDAKRPTDLGLPYIGKAYDLQEKKYGIESFSLDGLKTGEYSISYDDNVNAGTVKVTVNGLLSYKGSKKNFYFKINPVNVEASSVSMKDKVTVNPANSYNPALYKDALEVSIKQELKDKDAETVGTETLALDKDYTVDYYYTTKGNLTTEAAVKADKGENVIDNYVTAVIKTTKDGNYEEKTIVKSAKIARKTISNVTIEVEKDSYTYTGKEIVPNVVVKDGTSILEKGVDYSLLVKDNKNVGTATITVKALAGSDYEAGSTATTTFEITPAKAEDVKVVLGKSSSATPVTDKENIFMYNKGKQIKPAVTTVELDGVDVTDQFDILYPTYGDNNQAGKEMGTVTIAPKTANKNFTGTKTQKFDIKGIDLYGDLKVYGANKKEIKRDTANMIPWESYHFYYNGGECTFADEAFVPSRVSVAAEEGKDYEIKYIDNVDAGVAYVAVVAKGNYEGNFNGEVGGVQIKDGKLGTIQNNIVDIIGFQIKASVFTAKNITVTNGVYASGLPVKPQVTVSVAGKTLVEGKDYKLNIRPQDTDKDFTYPDSVINATEGKIFYVDVIPMGGYEFDDVDGSNTFAWGIDKFDFAAADIQSVGGQVTVKNGNIVVDPSDYVVTKDEANGTVTVSAKEGSKNYTGSQTVKVDNIYVEAPVIKEVKVVGNKATVILSGECEGADGYDYVISKANDYETERVAVNKNKLTTTTDFNYVDQDVYYAYCHAWTRGEDGKKVFSGWSNILPFSVSAITPSQPVITSVKVNGSTVTVTYTKSSSATGYDVVLGSKVATVAGEKRPLEYGKLVKKNIKGNTVTATFKNVKKGTYYAGLHAFNRTSEDGKKVFSPWSNVKRVTVK